MLSRLGMMLMESGLVSSDEINQIVSEYGPGEIELADQLVLVARVRLECRRGCGWFFHFVSS